MNPGFASWLCHVLAARPWAGLFSSLDSSLLTRYGGHLHPHPWGMSYLFLFFLASLRGLWDLSSEVRD